MLKRLLKSFCVFTILLFAVFNTVLAQKVEVLDKIVAEVNNHIILKSDVDSVVTAYMQQMKNPQFSKELWYHALESEVNKYVLLEKAKIDSVTVSDDDVNRELDQRIKQLEERAGGKQALENYFGKSLVELKAQWRGLYRQEAIIQKLRQKEESSIKITRPEVEDFFNDIPKDSIPTIPEEVKVAQIVKIAPPDANADSAAYHLAEELRDSIVVDHKSIEELAKRWSDGPSGQYGGHIPLMSTKQLVPSYAAAAAALQPGQISQVVKSPFGYHVIRLNKRVGDKIDTNQILIKIKSGKTDDKKAIHFLDQIRDSVLKFHKSFADMARKYSDDKATAPIGGVLENPQTGNAMIPLKQLDPALYRIVILLNKPDDISEPKSYTTSGNNPKKAYRIVQLQKKVQEHKANLNQDYQMIKNFALQAKQQRVMSKWMKGLRDEVYVEYKIPVPEQFSS